MVSPGQTPAAARLLLALLRAVVALAILALSVVPAAAEIVLTDAAGRQVRLLKPAERIVTNESLLLLSMALIERDPVARLAGWAAPRRLDRGFYEDVRARFPQIGDIPEVSGVTPTTSSAEAVLSAQPDLFVVSIWSPEWQDIVDVLERAGVPTIFLDGPRSEKLDPAAASLEALEILAAAIDRKPQARAYADYVREHMRWIEERLRGASTQPSVLIDAHATTNCCATPGRDNRLTDYVALARARSIGADVPGYDGLLSAEFVIGRNPDVLIATGGPHLSSQGGLVVGGEISPQQAEASLRAVIEDSLRKNLGAVKNGRAYGISHQLSISALSFLIYECFAKWLHPDLLGDVDPDATLRELNRRFLAVPLEGTFWIALEPRKAN